MSNTNNIALERIEEARINHSKSLDLSGLNLTQLPNELSELKQLEELYIDNNRLSALPTHLGNLSHLKVIRACNNQISNITKAVRKLNKLETLDLRNNKINSLPRELGQISHLKRLHLCDNNLTALPKAIRYLDSLTELHIRKNKLGQLPEHIDQLKRLQQLHLNDNKLGKLPTSIGNLSELEILNVDNNHLHSLQSSVGRLHKLERLMIANNQIHNLPKDIGNLSNLKKLDVSYNLLGNLPPEVSKLHKLSNRKLSKNHVDRGIELRGNHFNIPEEVLNREPSEVIQYILDLQASAKNKPLHEAKLIFIGSGYVGKTSLINRLLYDNFQPEVDKTDGIQIRDWHIKRGNDNIKLHVWDFGGQEIMHATHKLFMTARSVYVLVINPRTEDKYGDSELEYWLKLIRSYAQDVPVVIAINKCETHKIAIPKGEIRDKYPNIVGFVETSCKKNIGIGRLHKAIERSIARLEHIDDILPQSYFEIKNKLESYNGDYIPYSEYQGLCRKIDKDFREKSMQTLMRLLHDLGVMLNFSDDRRLTHTQVLNPEWVTRGVYQIITSPRLIQKKGILTYKEISRILDAENYPSNKERYYIMDIMDRFELCYQMPNDRDTYFVPGAFPIDRPKKFNWKHQHKELLRFQYHYDVMPSSIMSRFIVKVHDYIKAQDYWRNGVVIKKDNCNAYIKADPEECKIFIEVAGKGNKRDLLALIRSQFEILHNRLSNIKVDSKIPVGEKGEIVIDYDDLLFYEEMEESTILVRELRTRIDVKELLNGVVSEQKRNAEREAILQGTDRTPLLDKSSDMTSDLVPREGDFSERFKNKYIYYLATGAIIAEFLNFGLSDLFSLILSFFRQ